MAFNPYQIMQLQFALQNNPSMVPILKQQMGSAVLPDENTGNEAANAARGKYYANRVNPVAAQQRVADGPYASSFASQRQADIMNQGAVEAQAAADEAKNAELDRRMRLYQLARSADDQNWQQLFGEGGPLSQYASSLRGSAGGRSGAGEVDEQGNPSTFENIARIGTGVAQLGKQYLDAKAKGQQPLVAFGQGVGTIARDVVNAPSQLWGGIKNAFRI